MPELFNPTGLLNDINESLKDPYLRGDDGKKRGVFDWFGDVVVEVAPFRVVLLNQVELPDPMHLLDRFFSQGCRVGVLVALEINQLMNCVLTGYACDQVAFMVEDTVCQVLGHADVKCAVALAR